MIQGQGSLIDQRDADELLDSSASANRQLLSIALLTGGIDRPYVYGLTNALSSAGLSIDLIGSDELDEPDLREMPGVNFLNLRGDLRPNANLVAKTYRILAYYWRLIRYAATAKAPIFHILWNNKFEAFDRTLLTLYYKLLGKAVVMTVHNVNKRKRDSTDTVLNRLTLRMQYRLLDHLFVHTTKMKSELMDEFGVRADRITVIPFGINNSVPDTDLSPLAAKQRLGIRQDQKSILFFGRIKQYKGLEYLITAFESLVRQNPNYQLTVVGRLEEGCESYWESIRKRIRPYVDAGQILARIEFIPDSDIEVYFKATDVFVLPYTGIFQSGVIFLGYNFGLPVVAADVGSLKDEIVEGATGFVFRPEDPNDLAQTIDRYFASDLFARLDLHRLDIREFARKRHSWEVVSEVTTGVYANLVGRSGRNSPSASRSPLPGCQ